MRMLSFFGGAVTFSSLFSLTISQSDELQSSEFLYPSVEHRSKFRYWLPDASVSPEIVARDIQDAKAAGAGGLEFLPFYLYGMGEETFRRFSQQTPGYWVPELPDWTRYGFGTPAFVSLFKSTLKAAQDIGIVMDYSVGANQGQGVPADPGTPGLAVELLMGNTTITPRGSFSAPVPMARQPSATILSGLNFMHPLEQFGTPNLTAVIAYQVLTQTSKNATTGSRSVWLNQSSFIDLMPLVKDGWSLQWSPPDTTKTWKIFSFWEAYTNQRSCDGGPNAIDFIGNGSWTVDHFSKAGAARVTNFWDEHILSNTEVASLLKSVGKYAWEDSMEILSALYWTPGLLKRFRDTHGYDLTPYLPVLFSQSNTWGGFLPVYTEVYGFGNDTNIGNSVYQLNYRGILNDGYQDYLSHFRNWSRSIGTAYSAQPAYNLPLQMLSDIPLVDAPEGESFGFSQLTDVYRQFAGPAHLANISVISTELGAVRVPAYSLRIPDLLQQIKRSFAGGFTMNVIHGFPSSSSYPNTTWPGYTTFFYEFTEMWNRIQPCWQHMADNLDFVARNQLILQKGSPRVDLAFYLFESPWSPRTQYNSTNLQDLGFNYDYIGPDNLPQAFVKDKELGIPGYKAIIFNKQNVATIAATEALIDMASAGLPIVFIGSTPNQTYPVDPSSTSKLIAAMEHLLSLDSVQKISSIDQLPSTLAARGIAPRTPLNCSSNPVFSVLRSSNTVDYVYLFNDQSKPTTCTATIKVSGPVAPYVYNAWTGSQSPLLAYSATNSTLTIPISLKSNETLILALHRSTSFPKCSIPRISGAVHSLNATSSHVSALVTGSATLTSSSGTTSHFNSSLPAPLNLTTWDLVIEDWHSSQDRFAIQTEVTNHTFYNITLRPWTTHSLYVSGIGHYTTSFQVPSSYASSSQALVAILSLPVIQHTARIYLDAKWLGPIDPINPMVELRGLEPGKEYQLRVDVSTTLFNRIKADANDTMIVGQVAGQRQPGYINWPYEEYGLIGDVVLSWGLDVFICN